MKLGMGRLVAAIVLICAGAQGGLAAVRGMDEAAGPARDLRPGGARPDGAPVVDAPAGQIQGVSSGGVARFLGIPYAAPPVGALRFQAPQPAVGWQGVLQATQYGSECAQRAAFTRPAGGAEDCLFLNVFSPAGAAPGANLPVIVWIHGGGLYYGAGADADCTALALTGKAIFVSINYRLGLFGFLAHPALGAEQPDGASGNYGSQDQIAAIAWVARNIGAFGGNPARIMIAGESAGGGSVFALLTSPLTPRIAAAAIESGIYAPALPTRDAAEAAGVTVANALGCASAACLRALSTAQLVAADGGPGVLDAENIDNRVLPRQPYQAVAAGQFQRVPLIDGSNHDEYRIFMLAQDFFGGGPLTPDSYVARLQAISPTGWSVLLQHYPLSNFYNPNYAFAQLATDYGFACGARLFDALASAYTHVYAYEFSDPHPAGALHVPDPNMPDIGDAHGTELPYLFPSAAQRAGGVFTPGQARLAGSMRAAWASLAEYGRPLMPQGGAWRAYAPASDQMLSLVAPAPVTYSGFAQAHQCGFWTGLIAKAAGVSVPQGLR